MNDKVELPDPAVVLQELRDVCAQIRKLISTQYAPALIGYLWNMVWLSLMARSPKDSNAPFPVVSFREQELTFAMEYVHAVIACDGVAVTDFANVDEGTANSIIELSKEALKLCFAYGFSSSMVDEKEIEAQYSDRLAFQILNNWTIIRGRRYQVLESEFFAYVLEPHDEILKELFGIDSRKIADEIQKITDATRKGFADATKTLQDAMEASGFQSDVGNADLNTFQKKLAEKQPELLEYSKDAILDLFFGGTFNLSKKTELPTEFLKALAFEPGENSEFFADTEYKGTPFNTLPGKLKPLIRIGDDFYCTEPSFIRDTSYRALQRAVLTAKPDYRHLWGNRQASMAEMAFADVMKDHLVGAEVYQSVFYPIGKKDWAELDCLIICDDVLIAIEAKAGGEAMLPPTENLPSHVRKIETLINSAYLQSRRFLEYLDSAQINPIYLRNKKGELEQIREIGLSSYRNVFPIGLTLESFAPFSAGIKEGGKAPPILDLYPFVSLSVDDLFVIRRILSGTGEFLHYLQVRQALAGIEEASLSDEMDHLGIYISQNRADEVALDLIAEDQANHVAFDGFDEDVLGPFFHNVGWPDVDPPRQSYPEKLQELLLAIQKPEEKGWLAGDSYLRDLGGEGRKQFEDQFEKVFPILKQKHSTFFATGGGGASALFWLTRRRPLGASDEPKNKARAMAHALGLKHIRSFEIAVEEDATISHAISSVVHSPTLLEGDYFEILREAELLKRKI